MHRTRRLPSAVGALLLSAGLTVILAAPAFAQSGIVAPLPEPGSVGGSVGEAVGGATGGGTGATEVIKDVAGTAGNTAKDVGKEAGGVVSGTGGTVGETVGGSPGSTIKDVSGSIGDAVKDTSGTVGDVISGKGKEISEAVDSTSESTNEVIKELTGGAVGGRNGNLPIGVIQPGDQGEVSDRGSKPALGSSTSGGIASGAQGSAGFTQGSSAAAAAANSLLNFNPALLSETVGDAGDVREPMRLDDVMAEVIEAARRLAFPLMLLALVVGYVVFQNRIDRKDPKLALAALDQDPDLLSFR